MERRNEWLEGMLQGRSERDPVTRAVAEIYPAIGGEEAWVLTAEEAVTRLQELPSSRTVLLIVPLTEPKKSAPGSS